MKIIIRRDLYAWLIQLQILKEVTFHTNEIYQEVLYDDQIYLENGYLIGQLLKKLLKMQAQFSEQLLKLRKIAFITSNENWSLIRDVLQMMGFQAEIDVHQVNDKTIITALEYLFDLFGVVEDEKTIKKKKKLHVDPTLINLDKKYEQSQNLLEYSILLLHHSFNIPLSDCLGLLINSSFHLKALIRNGTLKNAYEPVLQLYKNLLSTIDVFTALLEEEPLHFDQFMEGIGQGVISQSEDVAKLCLLLYENVGDGKWMREKGYWKLMQSDREECLELMLRKIKSDFSQVFSTNLSAKFKNKLQMMKIFNKIILYLPKCHYQQQIIASLEVDYYLYEALQVFDEQNYAKSSMSMKIASRQLISSISSLFWNKIHPIQKDKVFSIYDPHFCQQYSQKFHCVASLFHIISKQLIKHDSSVQSFFQIINKHYQVQNAQIKSFILNNMRYTYAQLKQYFPIGFFIQTYKISTRAQSIDYQMLNQISKDDEVMSDQANGALRIASVYYMQQLHAYCFIQIIKNMVKRKKSSIGGWAAGLSNELLTKFVILEVPKPPKAPMAKIQAFKLRSICSKKKQVLKYHEYHKFQCILDVLSSIRDKRFLKIYDKRTQSAIISIQKDKREQSKIPRKYLISLINKIRQRLEGMKDDTQNLSAYSESPSRGESYKPIHQFNIGQIEDSSGMESSYVTHVTPYALSKGQFEQNQFISDLDQNINAEQQGRQELAGVQELAGLLPFSSDQPIENPLTFYSENILENYENIYIKAQKQKHKSLIRACVKIYELNHLNLEAFFDFLGLKNYIKADLKDILVMEEKCKLTCDDLEELMAEIIVQCGLILFNFKKNRRINVISVESFFDIISEKVKNLSQFHIKQEEATDLDIGKQVKFEYLISKKLIPNHVKSSNFVICFEIVDHLLEKALNIHQIEPISRIYNEFASLGRRKQKQLSESEENQLHQLEELIESARSVQVKTPTPFKKKQEKQDHAHQPLQIEIPSQKSIGYIKKVAQLRNKLTKRRQQIQETLPPKNINDSSK